jgi:subtilase family serine protease
VERGSGKVEATVEAHQVLADVGGVPCGRQGAANYEEVEDVEVLHAVAPKAAIEIVMLPPNVTSSGTNFTGAVVYIVKAAINTHASVVSLTGSFGEHYVTSRDAAAMHDALSDARDHDITFVAASGDSGAVSDNGPPARSAFP